MSSIERDNVKRTIVTITAITLKSAKKILQRSAMARNATTRQNITSTSLSLQSPARHARRYSARTVHSANALTGAAVEMLHRRADLMVARWSKISALFAPDLSTLDFSSPELSKLHKCKYNYVEKNQRKFSMIDPYRLSPWHTKIMSTPKEMTGAWSNHWMPWDSRFMIGSSCSVIAKDARLPTW